MNFEWKEIKRKKGTNNYHRREFKYRGLKYVNIANPWKDKDVWHNTDIWVYDKEELICIIPLKRFEVFLSYFTQREEDEVTQMAVRLAAAEDKVAELEQRVSVATGIFTKIRDHTSDWFED